MGIRIVWDNDEKTILRYVFDEFWTWQDYTAARQEALTWLDTVTHKVGIILEGAPNTSLPPNMLSYGRSSLQNIHPNTSIVVFVIPNTFIRVMINLFIRASQRYATTLLMTSSIDEARDAIHERLSTLQNLPIVR